ncbi:hypothetical protein ARMSODRAFT_1016765 [Armillaria solidipes]|uniref:Uncharacterized protein n=1 Tax=Armillaria solidipes TaxID=1076256 RepID=A0A2H3BLM3_9AGAR|nr:hypothetical protein ARMSODRAFT_1016765 [Armillaria solidipes]
MAASDSSTATRDDALVSQLSDVHKYVSDVQTAQLPVQNTSMAENLHTLGESIAVFSAIIEHITVSTALKLVCASPVPMYFPAASPECSVSTVTTATIMAVPIPVVSGVPLVECVNWTGQHMPVDIHIFPPFSQVNPPALGPIHGQQDNCFVHV